MTVKTPKAQYVFCIKNDGYPVSLELRKVYQSVPDDWAARHGQIRVVDESGEDYLHPIEFIVRVALPKAVEDVFALAAYKKP